MKSEKCKIIKQPFQGSVIKKSEPELSFFWAHFYSYKMLRVNMDFS